MPQRGSQLLPVTSTMCPWTSPTHAFIHSTDHGSAALAAPAALVLLLSVMHAAHMINDAESHWLEGLQLVVTYFM